MSQESSLLQATSQLSMQSASASEQNLPSISWSAMSIERYATFEQSLGAKVLRIGDIWWVQIRPFFYRPLLPFKRYDTEQVKRAIGNRGVFQHAVMDGQSYDSYLNPVIFDDLQSYEPKRLCRNFRRCLKAALASGATVRRILDEQEFCEKVYPIYLSFYQRTGYRFGKSRREKAEFSKWAHVLFQFPEVVVLGAFTGPELVAVHISCLVENTLIPKALITSDRALKLEAPDLLLHCCRMSALKQPNLQQMYSGMLSKNAGMNIYKSRRGACVLALPASLHIHPLALWSIKKASPATYSRLSGLDPNALLANDLMPRSSGEPQARIGEDP